MFSARLLAFGVPSEWSRQVAARRIHGPEFIDLTGTNPTICGLPPGESALAALRDVAGASYEPNPLGLLPARQAVAADLARFGTPVDAGRLLLTASTSEAYGFLFKLLCDPGDEVMVPIPGYPLFEHLAAFDAVRCVRYPLVLDGGWTLDLDEFEACVTPGSRVLILISPHNPTGWCLPAARFAALLELAARHDLAVIVDEVFADFCFHGGAWGSSASENALPAPPVLAARAEVGLCVSLGGLSKSAGLPQMKVSWLLVGGEAAAATAALTALEGIADAYLSVATPQQLALPAWLSGADAYRTTLRRRLDTNRAALVNALQHAPPCQVIDASGGWMAVVRVPAVVDDLTECRRLLADFDLLVHPGYLFDMPAGTFLVLSLLPPCPVFAEGVRRLGVALSAGQE
ncbi:MAG: pyridoxal phosphate-dependent aminotransferase [Acidobacteriota bacterium]